MDIFNKNPLSSAENPSQVLSIFYNILKLFFPVIDSHSQKWYSKMNTFIKGGVYA